MYRKLTRRQLSSAALGLALPAVSTAFETEAWGSQIRACDRLHSDNPSLRLEWRFASASPFSSEPAFAPSGQAYLATHEGYLHALSPQGGFLWSYTVSGALLERPATDEQGRVYAASSDAYVYGLNPSGAPHWIYPSPVQPRTPLSYSSFRQLYFGTEQFLYAVSTKRGLLWRAKLSDQIQAGPVSDPSGRAWLITADGKLQIVSKPWTRTSHQLPGADAYQLLNVAQQGGLILAGSRLIAVSTEGELQWEVDGVETATASEAGALAVIAPTAERARHLAWVKSGALTLGPDFEFELSAPPATSRGVAFLPTASGVLWAVSNQAKLACRVGNAPLFQPVFDPSGRLWATAGDGNLAAFKLTSTEGQ